MSRDAPRSHRPRLRRAPRNPHRTCRRRYGSRRSRSCTMTVTVVDRVLAAAVPIVVAVVV